LEGPEQFLVNRSNSQAAPALPGPHKTGTKPSQLPTLTVITMKTSSLYSLALALASATVLTESFSIRQILRVAAPRGRGGASVQRDAALVVDSSASAGALSQDLALLDEPRLYTQQGVARALPLEESSPRGFIRASANVALPKARRFFTKSPALGRLEIPRHVEPDLAKAKMVMSLEMLLGRAAMVASVVLFVVELTTGQSLPDQLSTLL
jgi:hypothetical protein